MSTKYKLLKETENAHYKVIPAGTIVYACTKPTYGVVGPREIACTQSDTGDYPFFGVAKDQLEKLN